MTKKQMVLEHLKKHKKITPLEALREYGSMRLGAIIFDLRKDYNIKTNMNHIDILNINKTKNILSRKEIKQNSMEEEKSKTENNLIINNNNNIFKIFNHKIN